MALHSRRVGWSLIVLLTALAAAPAAAVDHVTLRRDGVDIHLSGQVLVEAQDGGLLLMTADTTLWAVQPDELRERRADDRPFAPLGREQLAAHLLRELPDGFRIHHTANYVICYNTSRAYAQWCGALYERLHRGFFTYWQQRGIDVQPPAAPLVALVFDSQATYARYARQEVGDAATAIIGYYSLRTNRVVMYDLTGVEGQAGGARAATTVRINQILSQPAAERTVATIIHEATHQLAFNSGLQARYADIPLWVSEGLAVYFETPDLSTARGWRTIGAVNPGRLTQFRRYLATRPADSLETLLASDDRLRNTDTALDAYAEAWALNYFLLRKRPEQYSAYLQKLAAKKPLFYDTPAERLLLFRQTIGHDLAALDAELVDYVRNLK